MTARMFLVASALCWAYALFSLRRASRASLVSAPPHPPGPRASALPKPARAHRQLSGLNDNIFTFIQISDIHISRSIPLFTGMMDAELPTIAPDLLFLSGDLIDAKTPSKLISQQYIDEWIAYQSLLNDSKITERKGGSFYFDQRGNHDCFNIGVEFDRSEYAKFSAVREQGWLYNHLKPYGTYTFAALDACPAAGMSRPINFFGTLDSIDMTALAKIVDNSTKHSHNHTFIATHYPTSTIVAGISSDGRSFSSLAKGVSLWVSGHLHKLIGNLTMHTYHESTELLELEIGDMKDNAMYRLVAVDHDFIAITDQVLSLATIPAPVLQNITNVASPPKLSQPRSNMAPRGPLILVTNPRDARYATPSHEPPKGAIASSTHIRILIYSFSKSRKIVNADLVSVWIDGKLLNEKVSFAGNSPMQGWSDVKSLNETENSIPLYVVPWDPSKWDDGRDHVMMVEAVDVDSIIGKATVVFRIDGLRAKSHGMGSGLGGWIVAAKFETLDVMTANGTYSSFRAALSKQLRILNQETIQPIIETSSFNFDSSGDIESNALLPLRVARRKDVGELLVLHVKRLGILWAIRLFNFANTPELFVPFFVYVNYLLVGPWFVGNFVPSAENWRNRVGLFYIYGIWFGNDIGWVPILDTWYIALWEHTSFVFPLLLLLAYISPPHPQVSMRRSNSLGGSIASVLRGVLFTLWLVATTYFGFFGWTYGALAVVLSPGKIWMCAWAAGTFASRSNSSLRSRREAWLPGSDLAEVGSENDEVGEDIHVPENIAGGVLT
ncbi:Transmembrane protein 62, partial [Entophlyctis sp. JEL0112]